MAVMTGTNRNRRRPETESAEEAERHTWGILLSFFPPRGGGGRGRQYTSFVEGPGGGLPAV